MQDRCFLITEVVNTIIDIYDVLKQQTDLSPKNRVINKTLSSLVRYVSLPHPGWIVEEALEVLTQCGIVEELRALCQKAEYELEMYYSSPELCMNFPYIDHYLGLSLIETDLAEIHQDSTVAFIGCGPLPWSTLAMTVIQAAKYQKKFCELKRCFDDGYHTSQVAKVMQSNFWPDWSKNNAFRAIAVEREPEAAHRAQQVIKKLGFADHIEVYNCDGKDFILPEDCHSVFIASMVQDKEVVINNLLSNMVPGKEITFLIRSVEPTSLRSLLYEPVEGLLNTMELRIPGLQRTNSFLPESGCRLINSVHAYNYIHTSNENERCFQQFTTANVAA